ncbi:MAG: hypothetical protein IAF58_07480 [Leptolyngbya sp.]|nr:hypothetical protein [Candidatus Melainabacteria bacterium]
MKLCKDAGRVLFEIASFYRNVGKVELANLAETFAEDYLLRYYKYRHYFNAENLRRRLAI